MDEPPRVVTGSLSTFRRVLANNRARLPAKSIALLELEISLAEMHLRVLQKLELGERRRLAGETLH